MQILYLAPAPAPTRRIQQHLDDDDDHHCRYPRKSVARRVGGLQRLIRRPGRREQVPEIGAGPRTLVFVLRPIRIRIRTRYPSGTHNPYAGCTCSELNTRVHSFQPEDDKPVLGRVAAAAAALRSSPAVGGGGGGLKPPVPAPSSGGSTRAGSPAPPPMPPRRTSSAVSGTSSNEDRDAAPGGAGASLRSLSTVKVDTMASTSICARTDDPLNPKAIRQRRHLVRRLALLLCARRRRQRSPRGAARALCFRLAHELVRTSAEAEHALAPARCDAAAGSE